MYDPNDLSALTYANGFTQWHYKTRDSAESVTRRGYFNDAYAMLRVGDLMTVNCIAVNGRDVAATLMLTVTKNDGNEIEIGVMYVWSRPDQAQVEAA